MKNRNKRKSIKRKNIFYSKKQKKASRTMMLNRLSSPSRPSRSAFSIDESSFARDLGSGFGLAAGLVMGLIRRSRG